MATYTSLRLGELPALTRQNVDLDKDLVTVVASAADLRDGTRIVGEPKSAALSVVAVSQYLRSSWTCSVIISTTIPS